MKNFKKFKNFYLYIIIAVGLILISSVFPLFNFDNINKALAKGIPIPPFFPDPPDIPEFPFFPDLPPLVPDLPPLLPPLLPPIDCSFQPPPLPTACGLPLPPIEFGFVPVCDCDPCCLFCYTEGCGESPPPIPPGCSACGVPNPLGESPPDSRYSWCDPPGGWVELCGGGPPPPPPPSVDLLGPATVEVPNPVILSWNSSNTDSCSASGGWSGSKPTSGSETIALGRGTYTFTLS
ncbi:MAG: hypothetical protein AAB858_01000, partial [Patescibacteria group bacterium]